MPKKSLSSILLPENQRSLTTTISCYGVPTEILEQIFIRLSERDLRHRASLVCKQWHLASDQFITRIAVWNINDIISSSAAQKALFGTFSSGLANTLECNFASEDDSSKESLAAWTRLVQTLTCPLDQGTSLGWAKYLYKSAHDLPSEDPPCFLHHIREIRFVRCYDVLKCLQPFDGRLAFLRALVITHFVPMYDSTLTLSDLLLICPSLKRIEVVGLVLDSAHTIGSSSDSTMSKKSKRIHGLVEFTARRVHVDAGTLNEILSSCPYLVAFVIEDVRLLSTDVNHRFGVFSEHSIRQQMLELVQNARVLCPRLKSIALTTESSYWTDLLMLQALAEPCRTTTHNAKTLDPSRSESTSIPPITSTVRQLTLRCNGADASCLRSQGLETQILTNLKELHITSHRNDTFQKPLLQRYLSSCSSLERLTVDRKLALSVDEMTDLSSFPFPPGSGLSPPKRFICREFPQLDPFDEFAPPTNWSAEEFMDMPVWLKERAMQKQPSLRGLVWMNQTEQMHPDQGPYVPGSSFPLPVPTPGTPFPRIQPPPYPGIPFTPSPLLVTPPPLPAPMFPLVHTRPVLPIPPMEIPKWACHNLRTLELRLSKGGYAFAVFGTYLVDHCPNLDTVLIQYPSVPFGHTNEHSQFQTQNELLPWRGLTRMRCFEMVVEWIGHLGVKDFAFLASRQGDDTLTAEVSCSAGSAVRESKDLFWPQLEEFALTLDSLHLAGEMTKRADVRHLRSNHMQQALAQMRPQVAFVFGHEGRV